MIIKINNIDRTELIEWQSFKIITALTREVDSLFFSISVNSENPYKPFVGNQVEVYDGDTKIFGGEIIKIEEVIKGGRLISYRVSCQDYTHLMDKKLVFDTYENEKISDIVIDIIDKYCPGFTSENVEETNTELEYILFNYQTPSSCLKQLADLIGFDWYVDYDKDIHFFNKKTGEAAAFNLDDTSGNYIFNSLVIEEDDTQLRNVLYVRGGEYVGDEREDKVGVGDGTTKTFKLPYRYDTKPVVTVNSVEKTVGIDFIDSEDEYDCLWNYQEKIIRFKTAPSSGDVKVRGCPLIPVLIKAKRNSSINAYGEYEYVVVDKTIKTKQTARQRAEAEFLDYAAPIKKAHFITTKPGLRPGQKIHIGSDIRKIDQDYIIEKITIKMRSPAEGFYYEVDASTGRTLGIINFLQKQIEDTNKKVGILKQEGEVLDIIVDLQNIDTVTISELIKLNDEDYILDLETIDTVSVSESLIRMIKDSPPTWVYGPYFPTNDNDRKRPAFFNRSCNFAA